jgi:hypothetical protein
MSVVIVKTLITTKISCNSIWMAYMHTYIDCAFWTMCDFSDPFFLLLSQYWEQPLAPRFELIVRVMRPRQNSAKHIKRYSSSHVETVVGCGDNPHVVFKAGFTPKLKAGV